MSVFGEWQPVYAAVNVPTFPVKIVGNDKIPAVRGWQRVGLRGSAELAIKFSGAETLGIRLKHRFMLVDVDTQDENVLADVLSKHGDTPLIARTTSKGGFHVYYGYSSDAWERYGEQRRAIRPENGKPIDYLGTGFAVAPPSRTAKGRYEFLRGSIEDIPSLPPFGGIVPSRQTGLDTTEAVVCPERAAIKGTRNNALFRACMRQAHKAASFEELLAFALGINADLSPPMENEEVMKVASSAWGYTERGENRFGQHGAYFPVEEFASFLHDQDAFFLLAFLRVHNGPRVQFWVSNGLSENLGWRVKRLAAARQRLIDLGCIEQIRRPSRHTPALFQWA